MFAMYVLTTIPTGCTLCKEVEQATNDPGKGVSVSVPAKHSRQGLSNGDGGTAALKPTSSDNSRSLNKHTRHRELT